MIDQYILSLAREYLDLCAMMASGAYDAVGRHALSSLRTGVHDELIRVLGNGYERPFDMKSHCRRLIEEASRPET